jgi:hypothetical protein
MNIAFHTLAAFATGTALAARMPERPSGRPLDRRDLPWLAAGLAGNVLLHAAMDLAPHTYPIPWRLDMAASAAFIALVLAALRPRYALLLAAAFLGGLLPDLVDQGPGLLNRLLGLHLPTREFFIFHSLRYVVAASLGHEVLLSAVSHGLVLAGCAALLVANRRALRRMVRAVRGT